jgi:hypothetical protein
MPVAVFLVGCIVKTSRYSHKTALNMAVVGIGVAIASYGEINFVLIGVILQLIAIFCESFRIVLIQARLSRICCAVQTLSAPENGRFMVIIRQASVCECAVHDLERQARKCKRALLYSKTHTATALTNMCACRYLCSMVA